jgi:hypothetical protein
MMTPPILLATELRLQAESFAQVVDSFRKLTFPFERVNKFERSAKL